MKKINFLNSVIIFLVPFIQSCGKGPANDIIIEIVPKRPKVIQGDYTRGNVTLKGPWFAFSFKGENKSDKTVTIASFTVEVTTAGNNNNNLINAPVGPAATYRGDPKETGRVYFHIVSPGEKFEEGVVHYFESLPENQNQNPTQNPNQPNQNQNQRTNQNFNYNATMIIQGWFNKKDNPDTPDNESTEPEVNFRKIVRFRASSN